MSIVTEDGSGKADAETYISVTAANTYHAKRMNTGWEALEADAKEASLREATEYMLQVFRTRWKGGRVSTTQALDWPRVGVETPDYGVSQGHGSYGVYTVPFDTVPVEVQRACAELALKASVAKAAGSSLTPDLEPFVKSETLGPLAITYEAGVRRTKKYEAVEQMLKPLLCGSDNSIPLYRA